MKKFLALILTAAMAVSASAATQLLFNRAQFQPFFATEAGWQLTVPFIYKGTLTYNGINAYDDDRLTVEAEIKANEQGTLCEVDDFKKSLPLYMTICQPCIDCYPCTQLGKGTGSAVEFETFGSQAEVGTITVWNLYVLDGADVYKIDLLDRTIASEFFTGAPKKEAFVMVDVKNFFTTMTGKKSDYKFVYLNAEYDGQTWNGRGGKQTAYIKSVTSFKGIVAEARMFGENGAGLAGFQFTGTIKLTRNAALTKWAVNAAFGADVAVTGKNWEDCSVLNPASICEEVLSDDNDSFDEKMGFSNLSGLDTLNLVGIAMPN